MFRLWFWGGFRVRGRGGDSSGRGRGGFGVAILIAVVLIVVAWVLSLVIRLALSRSREFLADAGSVELTKNPDAMIMALRKIEGRGELPDATSAVMEMCVDNPRSGFSDLFSTHPSVENRVDRLVRFAGGHDPGPVELPPPRDQPPEGADNGGFSDPQAGPWSQSTETGGRFLPPQPPTAPSGPWGPRPDG
jgi:heat shock protein HtpX